MLVLFIKKGWAPKVLTAATAAEARPRAMVISDTVCIIKRLLDFDLVAVVRNGCQSRAGVAQGSL